MITDFKPHPKQKMFLESQARFLLAKSGIQGGKTTVGGIRLCSDIYKSYQAGKIGDWLLAAPTAKILQQSTLPKFKQIIPSDWYVWKESRQVFELVWGDRIFVRSTDNPDYLEGMTLLGAWLDEAGQTKKDVWINLQGRLSINQGRLLMTTTPYGDSNWTNRYIYEKAGSINGELHPDKDKDIAVLEWTSVENPAFPREEYERAKSTLDPHIFNRRYNGVFTKLEGLVYSFGEDDVVEPFDIPQGWPRFGGMDFGKTNPTAIVGITEDPIKHVFYVFSEYYRAESLLRMSAQYIQEKQLKRVLADPQSAQLIMELSRQYQVSGVQPAENDIEVGIERIQNLLKEKKLKIFKTCDNLIEELYTYHYGRPDEDGYTKDKPVAKNNHAVDALRYAFSKNIDVRKIYNSSPEKSTLRRRSRSSVPTLRRSDLTPDLWTGYC